MGPQCFLAVPFRWAVGAIVVFNVTPVVVALITGPGPGELTSLIASGVLTVAFSVMFGLWVFRIIAQSYDRASLISELGQTRAELAQANRRAGVLAERQRLSGEIHDTVAQGFTSIIMLLQAADADVEREPAAAREHLALALQTARENLAEARALVAALAPAGLEPGALDGALRRLTDAVPGHLGPPASFEVTGPGRAAAQARRGHAAPRRPGGAGQRAPARPGPAGAGPAALRRGTGRPGDHRRRGGLRSRAARRGLRPARDAGPGRGGRRAARGAKLARLRDHGERRGPGGCPRRPGGDTVSTGSLPAGSGPVRVLVADDHPVVRAGLRALLGAEPGLAVVAEAGSGEETVLMARQHHADVVLMDLRMPGAGGLAAIRELSADQPGVRVVVLTTYDSDADILPAVEAGAAGYLLKDTPRDTLVDAIFAAARGETVLAPSVAGRLVNRLRAAPPQPPAARETLSARETEVLVLAGRGLTNAQIGRELFVSEATVKTHLLRAYAKLGVSGRTAAVTRAMELGLLPSPGHR